MVKILFLFVLFSVFSQANVVDDGYKAYNDNDHKRAVELWSKACNSGDIEGCIFLGLMYKNGEGVKQDTLKAIELFTNTCNRGAGSGCYNLGMMYKNGEMVRQDREMALKYFNTACNLKYSTGCSEYKRLIKQQ